MNDHIRVFIAIDLDPKIRQTIKSIQDHLRTIDCNVTWVRPENVHLTLKFLGEINPKRIDSLIPELSNALQNIDPILTKLTQLGAFPSIQYPRVLWIGLKDHHQQIFQLVSSLEKRLATIGFKKERKAFSLHITIGRIRSPKNINKLSHAISSYTLPSRITQTVLSVALYKSTLTPQGPIYEVLKRFPLYKNKSSGHINPPALKGPTYSKAEYLTSVLMLPLSSLMILIGFSHFKKIPLRDVLSKILTTAYVPHINSFDSLYIAGTNVYTLLYLIFFLSLLLRLLADKIFKKQYQSFISILSSTLFFIYTLTTISLTINWAIHSKNVFKAVSGLTIEEKYAQFIGGGVYIFSKHCQSLLPGYHSAELISDMDFSRDPGMLTHRMLAYFLYPIDIRGIHKKEPEVMIFFAKDNAEKNVPENFRTLFKFNEQYLIALKKNK
jgi:2'-5' RNA ligase